MWDEQRCGNFSSRGTLARDPRTNRRAGRMVQRDWRDERQNFAWVTGGRGPIACYAATPLNWGNTQATGCVSADGKVNVDAPEGTDRGQGKGASGSSGSSADTAGSDTRSRRRVTRPPPVSQCLISAHLRIRAFQIRGGSPLRRTREGAGRRTRL